MTLIRSAVAFAVRLVTGARPAVVSHDGRPTTVLDLPDQAVFFANHSSHLDFLTIWAVLPGHLRRRVRPVAAADYWGSGWKGRAATALFNPYLVERGATARTPSAAGPEPPRSQIDGMIEVLALGDSLTIFPEGTRGDGHEIAPFHAGIARLARAHPEVPIQPVALTNLGRILPKGGVIPVPLLATVRFLEPIALRPGETDQEFLVRARQVLVDALPDPEADVAAELERDASVAPSSTPNETERA